MKIWTADSTSQESIELINVKAWGAKGDGTSDDTAAIQAAIDATPKGGVVFFPNGHYRMDTIRLKSHLTLAGHSAWSYRADDSDDQGGTVLSPLHDDQACLLNWNECAGTRITGLTLDGNRMGASMDGIISKHGGKEQHIVVENCRIVRFTGSGLRFQHCWVWLVRNSLLAANGLDGLDLSFSYDGWLYDNQFAGNGRCGIRGEMLASATITANRIEWNGRAGVWLGPDYVDNIQIANCFIDRNYGPGIEVEGGVRCTSLSFTGNMFRYNGYERSGGDPELDCHVRLLGVKGLSMTGNTLRGGTTDGGEEPVAPSYGIRVAALTDSVITGNSLYHGAMKELWVDGGNHTNTIVEQNPGSIQEPRGLEGEINPLLI